MKNRHISRLFTVAHWRIKVDFHWMMRDAIRAHAIGNIFPVRKIKFNDTIPIKTAWCKRMREKTSHVLASNGFLLKTHNCIICSATLMSINCVFAVRNSRIQFFTCFAAHFRTKNTLRSCVRENTLMRWFMTKLVSFCLVILIFNFLRSHPIEHKTYDMPANAMAHVGSPIEFSANAKYVFVLNKHNFH